MMPDLAFVCDDVALVVTDGLKLEFTPAFA